MAIIKCPECNKEISDQANSCPNCGYVLNNQKNKEVNKRILVIVVLVIIIFLIGVIGFSKIKSSDSFFQFGKSEVQNDKKSSDKGSISVPYNVNDAIEFTTYEVQGYNYATGIRTVANPAKFNLCIGEPLFELIGEVSIKYNNGNTDDHLYLVGLKIDCLSTTGDYTNLFNNSVKFSFITKDKKTVGSVQDTLKGWTNNEIIQKYSDGYTGNIYEGQTINLLVGGYEKELGISSLNDLSLLKISYYGENGEQTEKYVSLK